MLRSRLVNISPATIIFILLLLLFTVCGVAMSREVGATPYGMGGYGNCAYGGACSISLTTAGTLSISLAPTSDGVYSVQKDTVVVETKSPLGYDLALESNSPSSAALISDANSLEAGSGTPSSPTPLQLNTWGYRLDGQANFGAGPTTAVTNATNNSLSFAGLPLNGFPQTVYSQNVASATGGDTIAVWYGVRANNTMPSGSYQQTIIYTAVAIP